MAKLDMTGLGEIAIGILVLIVIYGVVPMVGSQMDSVVTLGATSEWNASHNPDVPTGVSLWTQLSPFIGLSAIIIMIAGFLRVLKGMREGGEGMA